MNLFDYPNGPAAGTTDTSREAAESILPKHQTIRAKIMESMNAGAQVTADEMAAHLGLPILSVRPRFSELRNLALIEDTGKRRRNRGGKTQIVWGKREVVA